jgi:hypothetical protein
MPTKYFGFDEFSNRYRDEAVLYGLNYVENGRMKCKGIPENQAQSVIVCSIFSW